MRLARPSCCHLFPLLVQTSTRAPPCLPPGAPLPWRGLPSSMNRTLATLDVLLPRGVRKRPDLHPPLPTSGPRPVVHRSFLLVLPTGDEQARRTESLSGSQISDEEEAYCSASHGRFHSHGWH